MVSQVELVAAIRRAFPLASPHLSADDFLDRYPESAEFLASLAATDLDAPLDPVTAERLADSTTYMNPGGFRHVLGPLLIYAVGDLERGIVFEDLLTQICPMGRGVEYLPTTLQLPAILFESLSDPDRYAVLESRRAALNPTQAEAIRSFLEFAADSGYFAPGSAELDHIQAGRTFWENLP